MDSSYFFTSPATVSSVQRDIFWLGTPLLSTLEWLKGFTFDSDRLNLTFPIMSNSSLMLSISESLKFIP